MRQKVFISHASKDAGVAQDVEAALQAAGYDTWLDTSDIHLGVLLRKELASEIRSSRAVVLLWSGAAAESRWVAAEVLRAFHSDRFIVPCVLDEVPLPQFLSRSVHLDLRQEYEAAVERLAKSLQAVPDRRNEFPSMESYRSQELKSSIQDLYSKQAALLNRLAQGDVPGARRLQAELDPTMRAAEERWRYDPTILNLAGYHRKNAYMLGHWDEYCAGRFPADPVLREGERVFLDTLFVNPTDCSALNGLGNVLLFEGELDAAEFFVERALECSKEQNLSYPDAEHDLKVIRDRKRAPELGQPLAKRS